MKTQPTIHPIVQRDSYEMLMRLLKVAELLNKGACDQPRPNANTDQKLRTSTFVEKERQKP
jgi:hypothetical protein